jgi:transcription initiation factor TFIID subunit 10
MAEQNESKMIVDDNEPTTFGQPLSNFLLQLEDYSPTIPDAITAHFLRTSGCDAKDPRLIRLISIAAQKFISDIANDALQHCKMRSSNSTSSHGGSKSSKGSKDRRYCLTMEDLIPASLLKRLKKLKPRYAN